MSGSSRVMFPFVPDGAKDPLLLRRRSAVPPSVADALTQMQENIDNIYDTMQTSDVRMAANYEELTHDIVSNQEEVKKEIEALGKAMVYLKDMVVNVQGNKGTKDLMNIKASMPGKFLGKLEESFRSWAHDLKAYTNGIHAGFRRVLSWAEAAPEDPKPGQPRGDCAKGDLNSGQFN